MTVIAHISDLHFGAEVPAVVAALAADIAAAKPDLVVVSGDLTQRARHREYAAAAAFLGGLPAPVLAVPGNHDVTAFALIERFSDPWARWRRHIAAETEPAWTDAEVAVVGLNTARRGGFYLDWSRGHVGRTRLARLEARLAALPPGPVRIVVAHHPFVPPEALPGARLVGGAARALALLARHQVRLLLTGHLHRSDIGRAGTPQVVQAATATSHRLRGAPQAWHRIAVQGGQVGIATRRWSTAGWVSA